MNKERRFNGIDWLELPYAWGLYTDADADELDEKQILKETEKYIMTRISFNDQCPEMKRIANDVREYLTALIDEDYGESRKVWETLLTLSDFTLLQMFCRLLPLAWS